MTILNRAVAGLTRSVQVAPEDETLSEMLASTRALLWETWERIALARLAAAMPWNGEILAAETTTVLTRHALSARGRAPAVPPTVQPSPGTPARPGSRAAWRPGRDR